MRLPTHRTPTPPGEILLEDWLKPMKLTQLGLDLSVEFCEGLVLSIAERAAAYDSFLRIDMEGSIYTQRTVELVKRVRAQSPCVGAGARPHGLVIGCVMSTPA